VSSVVFAPASYGQEGLGEGRTRRYAVVTGIRGSATNTQTVYVIDDVNQIVYAFEYHSRSNEMKYRAHSDIRLFANKYIEKREETERRRRDE